MYQRFLQTRVGLSCLFRCLFYKEKYFDPHKFDLLFDNLDSWGQFLMII